MKIRSRDLAAIMYLFRSWDGILGSHSFRVAKYARCLAERLDLNHEMINDIETVGIIHDIGKLYIPHYIINKPGRLTGYEWEIMKSHAIYSMKILSEIPYFKRLAHIAAMHHERWDGNGYPFGKAGEEIPIQARILCIADAFDAMTTERPYKKTMSYEEAIDEIMRNAGTQFWDYGAKVFVDLIKKNP